FSSVYHDVGLYDTVHSKLVQGDKLVALYFSVITITTTGYGDFIPINDAGRICAGIESISSYLVFGFIVATIISLFRQSVPMSDQLEQEVERSTQRLAALWARQYGAQAIGKARDMVHQKQEKGDIVGADTWRLIVRALRRSQSIRDN